MLSTFSLIVAAGLSYNSVEAYEIVRIQGVANRANMPLEDWSVTVKAVSRDTQVVYPTVESTEEVYSIDIDIDDNVTLLFLASNSEIGYLRLAADSSRSNPYRPSDVNLLSFDSSEGPTVAEWAGDMFDAQDVTRLLFTSTGGGTPLQRSSFDRLDDLIESVLELARLTSETGVDAVIVKLLELELIFPTHLRKIQEAFTSLRTESALSDYYVKTEQREQMLRRVIRAEKYERADITRSELLRVILEDSGFIGVRQSALRVYAKRRFPISGAIRRFIETEASKSDSRFVFGSMQALAGSTDKDDRDFIVSSLKSDEPRKFAASMAAIAMSESLSDDHVRLISSRAERDPKKKVKLYCAQLAATLDTKTKLKEGQKNMLLEAVASNIKSSDSELSLRSLGAVLVQPSVTNKVLRDVSGFFSRNSLSISTPDRKQTPDLSILGQVAASRNAPAGQTGFLEFKLKVQNTGDMASSEGIEVTIKEASTRVTSPVAGSTKIKEIAPNGRADVTVRISLTKEDLLRFSRDGTFIFNVSIDPDKSSPDSDRTNNTSVATLRIIGI